MKLFVTVGGETAVFLMRDGAKQSSDRIQYINIYSGCYIIPILLSSLKAVRISLNNERNYSRIEKHCFMNQKEGENKHYELGHTRTPTCKKLGQT